MPLSSGLPPVPHDPGGYGNPGARVRLGVLGGSFDPVHFAHLLAGESVREALALDVVLFVPVGEQPLKRGRPVTAVEHRVAMLQLAIWGNPGFALSRIEADRPGPSYTVDTLRLLRTEWEKRGPVDMWFITGSDSLVTLPRWRDPQGILGSARLAAVRRPGVSLNLRELDRQLPGIEAAVDWVEAPLIDISATDLRARVVSGRSIRYRVPESVREYIEANGIYSATRED